MSAENNKKNKLTLSDLAYKYSRIHKRIKTGSEVQIHLFEKLIDEEEKEKQEELKIKMMQRIIQEK